MTKHITTEITPTGTRLIETTDHSSTHLDVAADPMTILSCVSALMANPLLTESDPGAPTFRVVPEHAGFRIENNAGALLIHWRYITPLKDALMASHTEHMPA